MQTELDFDIDYETEIDWDEVERTIAANEVDDWKCPNTEDEVNREVLRVLLDGESPANREKRLQLYGWLYDHGCSLGTAQRWFKDQMKLVEQGKKPCMNV